MSEPRKNHLSINEGQDNEDENVSSYKPIPETDTEFRTSKNNLAKSKEKISPDGAEEKLLPKEEEAKIVTRVDMADAKYVVEDHRNGDAKIELDANKRQFSGLSKEELMKYADDPFWVNLRWFMFILFWALWLCMLAGAITIIIKAPKCPLQPPRTWFEEGPLVDMGDVTYEDIEVDLPKMQKFLVQGIFVDVPTYEHDTPTAIESFKKFAAKAKEYGIKVIADLIPNYVGIDHDWFKRSVLKESNYTDYFVWHGGKDFDESQNRPKPPTTTWKSKLHEHPWTFNIERKEYYLHQYGEDQPDLNFNNERVVQEFDKVIRSWMKAGAAGIRLNKARLLLVNSTLPEEHIATGKGTQPGLTHDHYDFWQHKFTMDQPLLGKLLTRWAGVVNSTVETPVDAVFTLAEEGELTELFVLRNLTSLRPPMTVPLSAAGGLEKLAHDINLRLANWPALQFNSSIDGDEELAVFSILLPAAPVWEPHQLRIDNDTATTETLPHLVPLRADAAVQRGRHELRAVPARPGAGPGPLLACARWKAGKSGYVAVYNPWEEGRHANLTGVPSLPDTLTVHHMSHAAKLLAINASTSESVDAVFVPARSTVILSYVPKIEVEK